MSTESRTPNPLLWIVLLAVLIEPLALALFLNREEAVPAPQAGRELADAIGALARQLDRLDKRVPSTMPAPTAHPAAGTPPDPRGAPEKNVPFPKPEAGVPAVPAASLRYPRNQANVDAWVNAERERKARDEEEVPTLFFHRTTAEILSEFGVPDEAMNQEPGVRWYYRGTDDRGSFMIDFHRGRVYRFWFDD